MSNSSPHPYGEETKKCTKPSTESQISFIEYLLKQFGINRQSHSSLQRAFPLEEVASAVIKKLKEIHGREAERINNLPPGKRVFAHMQLSEEDRKELRKICAKGGKNGNQS